MTNLHSEKCLTRVLLGVYTAWTAGQCIALRLYKATLPSRNIVEIGLGLGTFHRALLTVVIAFAGTYLPECAEQEIIAALQTVLFGKETYSAFSFLLGNFFLYISPWPRNRVS